MQQPYPRYDLLSSILRKDWRSQSVEFPYQLLPRKGVLRVSLRIVNPSGESPPVFGGYLYAGRLLFGVNLIQFRGRHTGDPIHHLLDLK